MIDATNVTTAYEPENPDELLAQLLGEKTSDVDEFLTPETRARAAVWTLPRIYDAATEIAERDGTQPTLPAGFALAIASLSADRLATLYAMTQSEIDDTTGRLYWARDVLKRALEAKMVERRKERGPDDHGPIAIPHETLLIENKVDFEPYVFDVDQIFEGLRGLPDDEIAALLRIEPERVEYVHGLDRTQIAALMAVIADYRRERDDSPIAEALETLLDRRIVPGSMAVRNTATLLAWLRRNAGSERAKIVAMGVRRNIVGSTTTIRPKTITKRVDPIVPQPAIATTEVAS
jgi:hypothetical protein